MNQTKLMQTLFKKELKKKCPDPLIVSRFCRVLDMRGNLGVSALAISAYNWQP